MTKILVGKVAVCIKAIRKRLNLSQEELADLSGLDRTYISGVERGVRNITLDSLEAIIFALDISIGDFFKTLIEIGHDSDDQKEST